MHQAIKTQLSLIRRTPPDEVVPVLDDGTRRTGYAINRSTNEVWIWYGEYLNPEKVWKGRIRL